MADEPKTPAGSARGSSAAYLRVAIGLAVSAVLFYLAWRNAGARDVLDTLRGWHIRPAFFVLAALVDTFVLFLRAVKWRLILRPIRRVPVRNTFSATMIGVMTNNLLPLRIDEVARSFILGRREGLPTPVVFGTVAVERSVDVLVLFAAVAAATFAIPVPARLAAAVPYVGALMLAAGAVLVAAALAGDRVAAWIRRRSARAPGELLARACAGFAQAVRAFPRDWRLPAVFGLGVTEMALSVLVAGLTAAAVGLSIPLAALVVVVLGGYASFAIPSSPGSLGIYEQFNLNALVALFAIPQPDALAYVLVLHAMLIVPSSLIGLACLWRERLGFRRLVRARPEK